MTRHPMAPVYPDCLECALALLHRTLAELRGHGLSLPAGTITDGLQKLVPLFEPLYSGLIEYNRAEEHWHCDETRWLVFEKRADKAGFAWMLWVFATKK